MKFLCPNCQAKYRIGPEKLVGRQAAKIRCRKCDYRIQIAYRGDSDEYDVTASPTSLVPSEPQPRPLKAQAGPPTAGLGAGGARIRGSAGRDESSGSLKPTAAVPGLPGLGSAKSARALHNESAALGSPVQPVRRALEAPPRATASPFGGSSFGASPFGGPPAATAAATGGRAATAAAPAALAQPALAPPPAPAPVRLAPASTQLADQFRKSVQAGGAAAADQLPQDGWFVGVNGVPLGPIPIGDLRELATAGHIDRRSLVWREGQGEWRPLGKFPQLARLLDDSPSSQSSPPLEAEGTAAPASSRVNGVGAHVATGFGAARPGAGAAEAERPSAWGDLDEEEGEDEQPTTVKGRVSAPPPAGAWGPAAPGGGALPVGAAAPAASGATGSVPISAALAAGIGMPAQPVSAPIAIPEGGPASSISATPEAAVDESDADMLRPRRRGRLMYVALAVVAAFALGAILTYALGPAGGAEGSKELGAEPSRAAASQAELKTDPPVNRVEEDGDDAPSLEPAAGEAAVEDVPGSDAPASALVGRPGFAPGSSNTSAAQPSKPGGSLLSGLGGPQTPGPSAGEKGAAEGPGGGPGLEPTAIQRTVRRYTPAVRQNCWQRALNARAPGVPSSAKVTATITVEASGKVQSVTVSGAPRGYPGLARCIEGSVKGWSFPRSAGETVTNVPFMFVGQ